MKKKFLVLTLCFTLIFTSINFNKSHAYGGVISLPILATVSSLAVATGIVLNDNEDLYDIGYLFYDYIQKNNEFTFDVLKTTFNSSVAVLSNNLVSVDSKFLDIVKGFFDDKFVSSSFPVGTVGGVPYYPAKIALYDGMNIGNVSIRSNSNGNYYEYCVSDNNVWLSLPGNYISMINNKGGYRYWVHSNDWQGSSSFGSGFLATDISIPYDGGYTWDNVENKKENDKIYLPIPSNLGQLVGQGSKDFFDNTDNLVGTGGVTIPGVDDPSIGFDDTISFPNVGDTDVPDVDVPGENIWSNITEYIIGLVVPSDTYWTDTFGGLYNNFTTSFPMVDMDNFNNLVTGEKKFPNIDIDIMGVKGRVVNGDVINSIVDWLRPIVAGFMMLCLMLFNYRKIYKTIRGVEPFQGIAQGTSDFRTGISEYNYMGTGLSKSDYEANQMELAKALYDYEQDTGKTYKIKI